MQFVFDRTHWKPLTDGTGVNSRCVFLAKTPLECVGAGMGNNQAAFAMAQYRECRTHSLIAPYPVSDDANSGLMRIGWNMNNAGVGTGASPPDLSMQHFFPMIPVLNTLGPHMGPLPVNINTKTTILWLPFERINSHNVQAVSSMGIRNVNSALWLDAVGTAPAVGDVFYVSRNFVWNFSSLGISPDAHIEDKVTQGVDWAYASSPLGIDQGKNIKSRGFFAQLLSQGTAHTPIDNSWDPASTNGRRLFNSTVSNDNTQWMSQVSDFSGPDPLQSNRIIDPTNIRTAPSNFNNVLQGPGGVAGAQNTIRTRIRNSTNELGYKVFDSNPTQTWGNDGSSTDGTVLIDDPQYGTIAESNSVRGEWVNWMFFGHVLDKAEKLILKSAETIIRSVSGRRRKGR